MSTANHYHHLASRPESLYRQLFIKGTRIRAEIIYRACTALEELRNPDDPDYEPQTPEEVATDFGLPLEAVQDAIDYCRSNPLEITIDHAREDLLDELSGMNHPDYKYNPKKHSRLLTAEEWARISDDTYILEYLRRRRFDAQPAGQAPPSSEAPSAQAG